MIEIVTLFLGLYNGPQMVEIQADDEVSSIELRLDGTAVATRSSPPWRFRIDLGEALVPHRLLAIARDEAGVEIGRHQRWVNRGAESREPEHRGLTAVAVRLDGQRELPSAEAMAGWFLARDGTPLEVVRSERGEALVIVVRDPAVQTYIDASARLYFKSRLAWEIDWSDFPLTDGEAFTRAAREVFHEPSLQQTAPGQALPNNMVRQAMNAGVIWDRWRHQYLDFEDDVTMRFISPRAPPMSRITSSKEIFLMTSSLPAEDNGLLWHAASVRPMRFQRRLSDAVAMAGLQGHASHKRRSVLLLTETSTRSSSRYPQSEVRRYLAKLQVPLTVWSFELDGTMTPTSTMIPALMEDPATTPRFEGGESWEPTRRISYPEQIDPAITNSYINGLEASFQIDLAHGLRRQRIVWLRGDHLPHTIRLSPSAHGVRLVGDAEENPLMEVD